MTGSAEFREYSFDSGSWKKGVDFNAVEVMLEEIKALEPRIVGDGVVVVRLNDISQHTLSVLTEIDSAAFGQPMGEYFVKAWEEGRDDLIFIAASKEVCGFMVIHDNLASKGLYYLDLAAAYPTSKGFGTELLKTVSNYMREETAGKKAILARTQNPAVIMSLKKVINEAGGQCFPVDRDLSSGEQEMLQLWQAEGHIHTLSKEVEIDYQKGIFFEAYSYWKPIPPKEILPGEFSDYLEREGIDFKEFCREGHAWMFGGTIE